MGVAGMVVATLASGFLQGRAQKQAYEAQAAQAEQQARMLNQNAEKLKETAERQDQANKINEETQRRRLQVKLGQQRAAIGASGITGTGSAANALMDSNEDIEREMGIAMANNRVKVDNIFQQQTDLVNQSEQYKTNAANYRAAGKQAFKNTMLQTAFSLAGTLYGSKSAAKQEQLVGPDNATGSAGSWSATSTMTEGNPIMSASSYAKQQDAWRKQLDKWGGY